MAVWSARVERLPWRLHLPPTADASQAHGSSQVALLRETHSLSTSLWATQFGIRVGKI